MFSASFCPASKVGHLLSELFCFKQKKTISKGLESYVISTIVLHLWNL